MWSRSCRKKALCIKNTFFNGTPQKKEHFWTHCAKHFQNTKNNEQTWQIHITPNYVDLNTNPSTKLLALFGDCLFYVLQFLARLYHTWIYVCMYTENPFCFCAIQIGIMLERVLQQPNNNIWYANISWHPINYSFWGHTIFQQHDNDGRWWLLLMVVKEDCFTDFVQEYRNC